MFVVWEPILPTDWSPPSAGVLARIPDARVEQFWDPDHRVGAVLSRSLAAGVPGCCRSQGRLWDDVAVFPPATRLGAAPPAWISGPVVDSIAGLRTRLPR